MSDLLNYAKDRAKYNFGYEGEFTMDTPLSAFMDDIEVDVYEYMIDFENEYNLEGKLTEDMQNQYYPNFKTVGDIVRFMEKMSGSEMPASSSNPATAPNMESNTDSSSDQMGNIVNQIIDFIKGLLGK